MNIRLLRAAEADAAGEILHLAFKRAADARGFPPAWATPREAALLAGLYGDSDPEGAVAAEDAEGRLCGVGFLRRRGEVATLGPLASAVPNRGIGGAILDDLITRAEGWGCAAIRLYQDAWNPASFALYASRAFSASDVVARIERPAVAPPRLQGARGLELGPLRREDLPELVALDLRLTGLEREGDLADSVQLVARRRGSVVGFLGRRGGLIGPALALDVADLGVLLARALADGDGPVSGRLSTAAPTAVLAVLALGFRIVELGTLMTRGATPPARPPQLYSILPEVL